MWPLDMNGKRTMWGVEDSISLFCFFEEIIKICLISCMLFYMDMHSSFMPILYCNLMY